MRFWSRSADRACCNLALPRPLKTKAFGFLALAAAASSVLEGLAFRFALSVDFFLAAFLTFLIFFLGAALLTAIWAFRTPQAAGAALHHKICKTAEACSRVGSQAAVH